MLGYKKAVSIIPILYSTFAFNVNTDVGFNDEELTAVVIEGDDQGRPRLGSSLNDPSVREVNSLKIVNGETATPHEFPWMVWP